MSYRLLSVLSRAPVSLTPELRTITLAAGHVSAGQTSSVVEAFESLRQDGSCLSRSYSLAILQSCPFVGFPRVLTAAAALQQVGIVGEHVTFSNDSESAIQHRISRHNEMSRDNAYAMGELTFGEIYGRSASKVRQRLMEFHPALDNMVIRFAYGEVLAAPGATLRERELCAVASLAGGGPGTEPLLVSHCRGALRVGASREELRAVLDHTESVHGADASERVEAVWYTFDRARNAL